MTCCGGCFIFFFFFQAEDGIRDDLVTGVQTCALPISARERRATAARPIFQSAGQLIRRAQPAERIASSIADPAPLARRGRALPSASPLQSNPESLAPASRGESRLPPSRDPCRFAPQQLL